jgi:tetratricopeptide (TPR) repeat protein
MEHYGDALTSAQKAAELNPKDAENWALIGKITFKLRRYQQAIAAYDRCLSLDKRSAEAYLNRGEAKRVLNDAKGACKDWQQVLKLDTASLARMAQNWMDINCE